MPVELWAASTAILISSLLIRYQVYLRIVGASLRQAVGGSIAIAAPSLVIISASLKATAAGPRPGIEPTNSAP